MLSTNHGEYLSNSVDISATSAQDVDPSMISLPKEAGCITDPGGFLSPATAAIFDDLNQILLPHKERPSEPTKACSKIKAKDEVAFTRVSAWLEAVRSKHDPDGSINIPVVALNKSCDIPTVAWRMQKHTGSDALEHYTHVEAADFMKATYRFKAWCMDAFLDHEAVAIAACDLELGTRHSCDGDVLKLAFLLLLSVRKQVSAEDCLKYVGGYGSMFTTHLCEHDDCTKHGYHDPLYNDQGYRCPDHGGVRHDTYTDCKKRGYSGEGYDGFRCTQHGVIHGHRVGY